MQRVKRQQQLVPPSVLGRTLLALLVLLALTAALLVGVGRPFFGQEFQDGAQHVGWTTHHKGMV